MFPWNTKLSTIDRVQRSGRDGVRQLLRRPVVQLLLLATAAVQVGAVVEMQQAESERARVALLAPVMVQPKGASVSSLWAKKATEREARRLARKYRLEGYPVSSELASSIAAAAFEHGIDLDIAFGLVRAESSFRTSATSPVGAVGLTQLMPSTARWLEPGVTRSALRDPRINLDIGFEYLRYLLEKYKGNEDLALLAYNRGPGTVDRALKRGGNPDNGYADFVRGEEDHGHTLFTE